MSFDIVKEAMSIISESITPHDSLMIALSDIRDGEHVDCFGIRGKQYTFIKVEGVWLCNETEWDRLGYDFENWIVGFVYNGWRVTEDDFFTEPCDHHEECEEFMRLHRDK